MLQQMRRAAVRIAVVGGAVAGVAVVAAAPAQAAFEYQVSSAFKWTNGTYWCAGNHGTAAVGNATAYGCFEAKGDHLEIADGAVDSKRVAMQWSTDYGRSGLCVNPYGKDFAPTAAYHEPAGGHACNKDFKEGHYITFRVGTCDGSKHDCTKVSSYGEWSDYVKRKNEA